MNLRIKLLADYYLGGAVHVLLKPFVVMLGMILRRTHSLNCPEEIAVIKMLGGGSLIIAQPSLLALKKQYPQLKLKLVTTPAVRSFAELTGIFDEIMVIRDDGLFHLAIDSIKAIRRLWRIQMLVDLEIHSRLSAIFTLFTCAINRVGIYTDLSFWRKSLYTHLIFYNKYSPVYFLYDHMVRLFGVETVDFASAKVDFRAKIRGAEAAELNPGKMAIGVAPACSGLSSERMLASGQWINILTRRFSGQENLAFYFIGGERDGLLSEEIITGLKAACHGWEIHNCCGKSKLGESVRLISRLDTLYCIDSSPIHFARLLGVKTVSFWGPTAPEIMLRPDPDVIEEVHYSKLSCSPCVHIAFEPPCKGNNICMKAAIGAKDYDGNRNPLWLVTD